MPLRDEQARRLIVQDLDTCILVEAGAGSGKTSSLVSRMVALIGEGRCRAESLAAITFTRKAAQELRGRFQVDLEKALAGERDAGKRERLGRGLDELDRCFLGTVHSFCAAILRERPIEAGLEPDFEELDELEDALLLERAWDEHLAGVQDARPELLEALQSLDVEAQDLRDCYRALSTYPDVEVVRAHAPRPDLAAVRRELYGLLDWAEGALPAEAPGSGWDGLQELLRTALQRRRIYNLDDDILLLRLLAGLDRAGNITQNRWRTPEEARQAKDRFETFRSSRLVPALRQWRQHRHAHLIDFVLPAIAHYEDLKREQSRLNYQDLLMNTADLLKGNPEVRSYFQGRYTHLLVDEFQDTDPIQAEIMFYLTGQDYHEQDWRRLRPKPGALFVVGDPKQSIYRFRRADIDTYNEVRRLIADGGGAVLRLTTNFRSVDALGEWANPVFQALLTGGGTRFQAAFEGLDTVRAAEGDCHCGLRVISIPRIRYHRAGEIARADADRIAAWISRALAGGLQLSRTEEERRAGLTGQPRPGDFLILMRYKANMDLYARALESHRIPYQITGGEGFTRSPELLDLLKLLRALLDPEDPVRLVAVLRGSLFGISDNQLYRFQQAGGHFCLYSPIPDQLEAGDREAFDWAFGQLRRFRQWTQDLPVSAALEAIVAELGSVLAALTGELGRSRAGRLVQCLEMLAAAGRSGAATLAGLVEQLAGMMEGAGIEEEIDIAPRESGCVRIMNLHKAKGLEAPVVFLANPAKNAAHAPAVHICRTEGTPRGYFVVEKRKGYASETLGQPTGWEACCETERQYLDAEESRLLYVAATRARNLLIISTYEGKPEINPWRPFDPYLAGVPGLDACSEESEAACVAEGIALSASDFDRAKDDIRAAWSAVSNASYSRASVTSLVKEQESSPSRTATGRGQSWGNVIHRLLDACAQRPYTGLDARQPHPELEALARRLLAEESRHPEEASTALQEVADVLDSPLWKRASSSEACYTEVPFCTASRSGQSADGAGDTILTGAIDLVFKEAGGWVIIDFKTDTITSEQQLAELAAYYAPQLEMYRTAWESMVGEPVHEVGLYFTSLNRWVVVKRFMKVAFKASGRTGFQGN